MATIAEVPRGEGGEPPSCKPDDPACHARVTCDDPVPIVRDGVVSGSVCEKAAARQGLTVIDLGDDWAPRVLGSSAGEVPYRERYVEVARERFGDDDSWYRERYDRYHELYGVFPTPAVVRARMREQSRHRCHDGVPHAALDAIEEGVDTWRSYAEQLGDHAWRKSLETKLEWRRTQLGVESIDALIGHPLYGAEEAQYRRLRVRHAAIAEMQAHFRCDGLLDDNDKRYGMMDGATIEALQLYLRRHMVISWQLDAEARRILRSDSRELDLLQLLRTLRERVVDATGLLEDGSAIGRRGTVAGRQIDTATLVNEHDGVVLGDGAPDLVALATDAAASALGWTSVAAVLAQIDELPSRVAVALPPAPAYHSRHMDLRMVIDRGDVWHDFPFVPNGDRQLQPRQRKPAVIVYAKHGDADVALVRWPTTIGGWHPERLGNGQVKLVYKESPIGPRIVRDVVAGPRWIPPPSTPLRDLFRPKPRGEWAPRYDTFGPHYASAYGMAMLIHHRIDTPPDGEPFLTDEGIRTHGSVSYASITDGFSHGCHRLHNHRALRLADFLLAHRDHQVRGPMELDFHKTVSYRGRRETLHFDSRGFRYELTPPLRVDVLEGELRGKAKRPLWPQALTRPMLERYR